MTPPLPDPDLTWLEDQIDRFTEVRPRYIQLASALNDILLEIKTKLAPNSIIQTRTKTISSFARKALRKKGLTRNPVSIFTDLCAGRIITSDLSEVRSVCTYIKDHFDIDWENSIGIHQRLRPSEFGYRSVHYIVSLKKGGFPDRDEDITIPEELYGLKAEIQVRTLLEHSWADFSHHIRYKRPFTMPFRWEREMAKLSAFLEEADCQLMRVKHGVRHYLNSVSSYMTGEQIDQEIGILECILKREPDNYHLAHEIARHAVARGYWKKVVDTLKPYLPVGYRPIRIEYGAALCNLYEENKTGVEYEEGQKWIKNVITDEPANWQAVVTLAGTYRDLDEREAERLYEEAFRLVPDEPYPLSYYLDYILTNQGDPRVITPLDPVISEAYRKSRDLADTGLNSPWTYYNMGKFSLLRGHEYEALSLYVKALHVSECDWPVCLSLRSLRKLVPLQKMIPGFNDVVTLHELFMTVTYNRLKMPDELSHLASSHTEIRSPVVIVAGGTDTSVEDKIQSVRDFIIHGFRHFSGTIISGGTTAGISGIVGELQNTYGDRVTTIGYLPSNIPENAERDTRYDELRCTDSDRFSPKEALQYWTDIIRSEISPRDVVMIGINGGRIAAAEFRIALALGATVGIIEGSGREASRLLQDPDWNSMENLIPIPPDPETLTAFIRTGSSVMDPDLTERLAPLLHHDYQERMIRKLRTRKDSTSLNNWDILDEGLKESSRQQAKYLIPMLQEIGYQVLPVKDRDIRMIVFTQEEEQILAGMEHGRWIIERLKEGWRYGPIKDIRKKTNPFLISWVSLPDEIKYWDLEYVRKIPQYLADLKMDIIRSE